MHRHSSRRAPCATNRDFTAFEPQLFGDSHCLRATIYKQWLLS